MANWLTNLVAKWGRPGGDNAHQIYVQLAGYARTPALYQRYDIADTLDGRFDALTLMTVLVIRRLNRIDGKGRDFGQEVVDVMFADMDLSLHEIGVSENKVSKKIKVMATAFLGRRQAYIKALDDGDKDALADALSRNLYRENGTDPVANGLVKAVMAEAKRLDAVADDELLAGTIGEMRHLLGKNA
ncbi:MAG: ubiquinol-cytochrome C chaperone [Alphaproteobacteria bacterium]|nr:ubiquinol-cytochrome C chaperone [Alphaproteobacteria bacterium]